MVRDRITGLVQKSVASLLFLAATGHAAAQVSSNFQINPAHTGGLETPERFKPPLLEKWAVDLGAPISYPVVADGLVFVTTAGYPDTGEKVFALSADTGKIVWEQFVGGNSAVAYLTWFNGTIFAVGSDGIIEASNAATGKLKWTVQITDQLNFTTPPVAAAGALYVVGDENGSTLYRINVANGVVEWRLQSDNFGIPALHSNVLVGGQDCGAFAISAESAAIAWQTTTDCGAGKTVAAIFGSNSFVGWPLYSSGRGVLLNTTSGSAELGLSGATPAFWGDLLLQAAGKLTATNVATQTVAWSLNNAETFNVPPIVVNSVAYALSASGKLYAVSAESGNILQTLKPGVGSHPIAGAGLITGLGAGPSILVVPSVSLLTAYGPR